MPTNKPTPTLKGIFVNSHINRLREDKGEQAVQELERRYGGRIVFKIMEDVPVREEVRILELCLALTDPAAAAGPRCRQEAGRLHFRNFAQTALGSALINSLPHTLKSLKTLLINSGSIARSIFKHTNFNTTERGSALCVVMENTDYPLEHFEGFFEAWCEMYRLPSGAVHSEAEGSTHRYTISGL